MDKSYNELEQAMRHPDVIRNVIKKDGPLKTESYSPSNPPPYPVTSVNGQTGDVSIAVPALPISISNGGTGADNAADARTNLGLGSAATEDIVPVSEGGTGASNAADARTNLGAAPMPTVVVSNTSLSGSNYTVDATYTVSGSGVVMACASIVSYANDYGQYTAAIYHNGTLIMGAGSRYDTSNAAGFGAAAAAPIVVANGDKIRIALQNTKAGAKSVFRRFLCFGCTVS